MLDPNERRIYLEALEPPPGYVLDRAIATTFTLDLLTLLIVPLSFVLFGYDREEDLNDQTKVLEALQRTSERFTVYCQKGRINVPKTNILLYSYLENTVVEVNQKKGVFHPKTWLLRFTNEGLPPFYRFICLSRNLTFDKSWDIILVSDGELKNSYQEENKPLVDYLYHLHQQSNQETSDLEHIYKEVQQVRFETPFNFKDQLKFWPLGIEGYNHNPLLEKAKKILIISPFVNDNFLKQVKAKTGASCILLSRLDSLDALKKNTLDQFEKVYVLDDPASEEEDEDNNLTEQVQNRNDLHAKVFVVENGNETRVLSGSANATDAAFSINTEFMVELISDSNEVKIDKLLEAEQNYLGTVISEYRRKKKVDKDVEKIELEKEIEKALKKISDCRLQLEAVSSKTPGTYDLILSSEDNLELGERIEAYCWPVTVKDAKTKDLKRLGEGHLIFNEVSTEAVTAFIAFEIFVTGKKEKSAVQFVLNLPLKGVPEDRFDKIIVQIISSKDKFLRYLLFLLAEEQINRTGLMELMKTIEDSNDASQIRTGGETVPLTEEMVRALSKRPEKIDRIARLVKKLMADEKGEEILPDDFNLIWKPMWEARQRMVKQNGSKT